MASALDVARRLFHLAAAEEERDYLTPTRLQKLVYYAQGWYLAWNDTPLFLDRIEAWDHGPVVNSVQAAFAGSNGHPLDPETVADASALATEESRHLGLIWEAYKKFSASQLRQMAQDEEPWKEARRRMEPDRKCNEEITPQAMSDHFKRMAALRDRLLSMKTFEGKSLDLSLSPEQLEELLVQHYPLSEARLAAYVRKHRAPQSWFEETEKPF